MAPGAGSPISRQSGRRKARRRAFYTACLTLLVLALVLLGLLVDNLGRPDATSSHTDGAKPAASQRGGEPKHPASHPPTPDPQPSAATSTSTSTSSPANLASPFGPAATDYLASRSGDATAAVYDMTTGQEWYLRPGDEQDTASIVKVDIMATLMAQSMASGQPISSEDQSLLTSMIEVSDNDAATTLWSAVGGAPAIAKYDASIGLTQTTPSTCLTCPGFPWPGWGLTTTTAADQVALLRHLLLPDNEVSDSDRTEALELLENVTPSERWGVTGGVPAGVTVALKNGWVPLPDSLWQIDSIGWINGDGRDYMIAVMTDGNPSEDYGIATVDMLSSLVWTALAPP